MKQFEKPRARKFDGLAAVARILNALEKLDAARAALNQARDHLMSEVNADAIPPPQREDYHRFLRAGGCTGAQYRAWLGGKGNRAAVKKRKHLRLVADRPPRSGGLHFSLRMALRGDDLPAA